MTGLLIGIFNAITGSIGGLSAASIFAIYKRRVIADGGIVENDACTIAFLRRMNATPASSYQVEYDEYTIRALSDGAADDSNPCGFAIFVDILNRT
jgi:hypothetical protein